MASLREDALKFETGRIKQLQEERLHIQKKTFTKWMNSFLVKARMEVVDLFTDLADGRKLLRLLEIISGEKLGKPNSGKMRVHKVENINKSLAFLHTKVRLESIGAEDIVDGNPRLILGLIWTIILRFQIQEIEIDVDEENESSEKKSAKDALLLWCQRRTQGYRGVNIHDFSNSWRSGLGFNALIHAHRPDLIDYESLSPSRPMDNLNNAFDIAQRELGIARLLDAEDMDTNKPDEKSVMTYVASYYHTFAKMKNEMKGGRRIANIVGQLMDADRGKGHYEKFTSNLLEWLLYQIAQLEDRNYPNSLDGVQGLMLSFKKYRTEEKPPKYKERIEVEAMLFSVQTKLKSLGQMLYQPPEGKLVGDIERTWVLLEKAEHSREVSLRDELLRQERLEQLAFKFERKSILRENYLKEMIQVLSDPRYGSNVNQVEATVKKHEAISADILARKERFHDLSSMAADLLGENYHARDKVKKRERDIIERWTVLLALLEKHRATLNSFNALMALMRDMDAVSAEIKEIEGSFASEDYGKHLMAIEDLLQKHSLQECQIMIQGDTIKRLNRQANQFIQAGSKEGPILQKRLDKLNAEYENVLKKCKARRTKLDESRVYQQFVSDHEEEEVWVVEKQRICQATIPAVKDLRTVNALNQKHKVLEDELRARKLKCDQLCTGIGEQLLVQKHPEGEDIRNRINSLKAKWRQLDQLAADRRKHLEAVHEAYQYHSDANESESWLKEKLPLVSSNDYGVDEPSAQSLLQRNNRLESEIKAYEVDIHRLNEHSDKLIKSGIISFHLGDFNNPDVADQWVEETVLVPTEVETDEIVEVEVMKDVVEERRVPQIKALYNFNGQGMDMNKGEVMTLIHKTNNDWWHAKRSNGMEGFIPANYVKECEPLVVRAVNKLPVKVQDKRRVTKTVMKKQTTRKKREMSPKQRAKSQEEAILNRQKHINASYLQLVQLVQSRRNILEDATRLFAFNTECDDFDTWMKDKEKMLKTDDKKDSVENQKRKFENFLTDLSASTRRIEAIDKTVENYRATGHSQLEAILHRQKQIHDRWRALDRLKADKEKKLEGVTSVDLFNRTCDDSRDWMLEKIEKMENDDLGKDLKSVQALQRKHQHLERELVPVEEKFKRVNLLANSVKTSYPNERANVDARQEELERLWEKVRSKAIARRKFLEGAVGLQIFRKGAKDLLSWIADVKEALNSDEAARDVATVERLLKAHHDLEQDIRAHSDEFNELHHLGVDLLQHNPEVIDVRDTLVQLREEQTAIRRGWDEKLDWLQQCRDLQYFNRDADRIDAITGGHETFLEFTDLGSTIDDVEALTKRHDDFENMLIAQDEKIETFSDLADKLIQAGHCEAKYINERRQKVLKRRQLVKEKAIKRRQMLVSSAAFQEFIADVNDMKAWVQDKLKTATDESYKDLTNLLRKVKKHEAFERVLKSNEGRLYKLNNAGQILISSGHYDSPVVEAELVLLQRQWKELVAKAEDKGKKLRQAAALQTYKRTMEEKRRKLNEIEAGLKQADIGTDLGSVKALLKKQQNLENELQACDVKLTELANLGDDMAKDGHFDAENIVSETRLMRQRFTELKEPCERRRNQLEESLRLNQFRFEVETELKWIDDRLPVAKSGNTGHSLIDAQNLYKKHQKFERELTGHQPVISKILSNGQSLIDRQHFASSSVKDLSDKLIGSWEGLLALATDRRRVLDLSLKGQQFFHEASEVESWMNEKNAILANEDCGRDEDAAVKLLTKHKAMELEIDSYSGLISEMGTQAQQMIDTKHPESKLIHGKQQVVLQQMKALQKAAASRRFALMESKHRHEYYREADDLLGWIREQNQTALSDEYGQDYEHLLILQNKFDDFRHSVNVNRERMMQCEESAKKLVTDDDNRFAAEIDRKQTALRAAWSELLGHIEQREHKLQAAGEIHRFNRDVAEALSRIQEKCTSIPDDLGRDLNSVQNLIRRHEGFENDLVALEAQLQVLVDDSARLQASYPGGNAEHILQQQEVVVEHYNRLQQMVAKRKQQLNASCDLHRFLASARDLINWTQEVRVSILTEEHVRDTIGAQLLKTEHDQLKAEIEARQESFEAVIQAGQLLIHERHYASEEIQDRLKALFEARQRLHQAWQQKKSYLDQLIDLQFFLRDAKQLDSVSASQEAYLTTSDCGASVEEVAKQMRKHEEFEKLMAVQDEKLAILHDHGAKLVQQNHFDSANIRRRLDEVTNRRLRVKEMCGMRRHRLEDALLYTQFNRDVADAELWIDEKWKRLEADSIGGEGITLEEKIKKLQKHQTFQAELTANEKRMQEIREKGETLVRVKQHGESTQILQSLERLLAQWQKLLKEAISRARGLEEAQDMLEFNNHIDKVETWIRDKEMMIQAGDVGRDYEHCLEIQRKLDDVDSNMRVDDSRITIINQLVERLLNQNLSDPHCVQRRREQLIQKWRALQSALTSYRAQLNRAKEIHAFNRDVDDTNERIGEKVKLLSVEDVGRDLSTVETLQRKLEALERDIAAIDIKLKEHDNEARRLMQKNPDSGQAIRTKTAELQNNWRNLLQLCQSRKQVLDGSYSLQKFKLDLRELHEWTNQAMAKMRARQPPKDVEEAEALLQQYREQKAEIVGRLRKEFPVLKDFGSRLIQQQHPAQAELEHSLLEMDQLHLALKQATEDRQKYLAQCRDLQIFYKMADQAETWLASKEAFLNNEDLGDSMSSVDTLVRKHDSFEKAVVAQHDQFSQLERFATELVESEHFDATAVRLRLQAIAQRRQRFNDNMAVRRRKLKESKDLQQFLRNLYEVESWIIEKTKVAQDENFREIVNLQPKIQKHQAFEAELSANKDRVDSIRQEGDRLTAEGHFAAAEIQSQVGRIEQQWRQLLNGSRTKKDRLNDAYQAFLLYNTLDDLDAWMADIENDLQSEDHGKDLTSVQNLLKKHQLLESTINNYADNIEQVKINTANLRNNHHFMIEEIEARATAVIQRYSSLHEPVQIRHDNLDDALLLQQLYRDIEDELLWIGEKEPLVASTDLGNSVTAVQNLLKKHQALESEIKSHESFLETVVSKAEQMMRANHYASKAIDQSLRDLQSRLQSVKDQASVRRLRLADAVDSQMFYAEVSEAETWIKDRRPFMASAEVGKDENSVQAHIKKLDNLDRDVSLFEGNITKLHNLCQKLTDRGHFDSANIAKKQSEVTESYSELRNLATERRHRLENNRILFKFLREANELADWMREQTVIACSEDYGRDMDHVEILIQKFDQFVSNLHVNEERVMTVQLEAGALVQAGHPEPDRIKMKSIEINQLWEELKEVTHARQEALAGAKQVHTFDRSAEETIAWILEKDAAISSADYGHDLESIQLLVRNHDGFERDLAAVKASVESVVAEARRLAAVFPDAREHIAVKHEATVESWNELLEKSAQRKDKLQQAEHLQTYFDEYRELQAWISEMQAKITAPELARDVIGAEELINRHNEYRAEISARQDNFARFRANGETLIANGHFLAEDIREKITRLTTSVESLELSWQRRKTLYEQCLDAQLFKRDADQLENWLDSREPVLRDGTLGDSIEAVEDLIRKHDDFEQTVRAQEEHFNALKRITLIEQAFARLKAEEEEQKKTDAQRREQERLDAMKRKEHQRILDARKKEDTDRRRTQEIKFGSDAYAPNGDARLSHASSQENYNESEQSSPRSSRKGSIVALPDFYQNQSGFRRGESMRAPAYSGMSVAGGAISADHPTVKRAESMRVDLEAQKKVKRTPSFTTRRRTQSFRKNRNLEVLQALPPVEMEGYVDRKQELQSGGKRATIRSWKQHYAVLCGQLLCFFRDKDDFIDNKAAAPPLTVYQAKCTVAQDYTKKKHVFRLQLTDGAEYLFVVDSATLLDEWVKRIAFHASLSPQMQLLSYDAALAAAPISPSGSLQEQGESTVASSQSTSPEQQRVKTPTGGVGGKEPIYMNVPPPPPPRNVASHHAILSHRVSAGAAVEDQLWNNGTKREQRLSTNSLGDEQNVYNNNMVSPPPPLPSVPPPTRTSNNSLNNGNTVNNNFNPNGQPWNNTAAEGYEEDEVDNFDNLRRLQSPVIQTTGFVQRHHSLPPGSQPPDSISHYRHQSATLEHHHSPSLDGSGDDDKKGSKKDKGVFHRLFRGKTNQEK